MIMKLFLVGAAITLASTAHSQQSDSLNTSVLDEVTITANKIPQKQSQTGKVVSVIGKAQLEKSQGKTLGQLLNEQAGITINGALNNLGTNQGVYMRGANIGRTLILVDGMPAYDPSFINNETDLNFFSLNNIERIEIARGAQSTLYGSDAIAGVINIITTKTAVKKPLNVAATGTFGSLNTMRGNLQVFGNTGKLGYSARYAKLKSDGFSAAHDKTDNSHFDKDGYNSDAFNASLNYQATSKLNLKTFFQSTKYKTDLDNGAYTDEKDFTNKNNNKLAGMGMYFKAKKIAITANYMYSENERNYFNDSTDVPGFVKYSTNDFFGKGQYAEVYSNIELGKGFTALAGFDFRYSSMNSRYYSLSSFGPYEDTFTDTSLSQGSAYASLLYAKNGFNLEGGMRYNNHQRYGSNATFTFNPSYAFNQHYRLFGSIASGFKAPSIYQLYSAFGNTELQPEESMNYELGLQQSFSKMTNRLVYFYRDITNGLDFDNINYQYFNISEQKVHGLELESSVKPNDQLTITLNYTFLVPTENVQSRLTFKDTAYNFLLRRPKHQLNATAGWQINPAFFVSINGKYVSDRYDVAGYKTPDAKLDAYFLLGAYAEYKLSKQARFFADFQNITNKEFYDLRGFNSIPLLINGGVTINL